MKQLSIGQRLISKSTGYETMIENIKTVYDLNDNENVVLYKLSVYGWQDKDYIITGFYLV